LVVSNKFSSQGFWLCNPNTGTVERKLDEFSNQAGTEVLRAAFSPDGQWLAVSGKKGKIGLLDAKTFKLKDLFESDENLEGPLFDSSAVRRHWWSPISVGTSRNGRGTRSA